MFKPLLRTLPSLSGNFTIACKLKEFDKESNNEYSTYVRLANIIPLQNFLANKNIELNLLNGKYEYDIIKYFYHYSNYFYKENFQYDKNNYKMINLDSLYNNTNDTRNKDYEFGCKRIQYSQIGSQFNFYAPIYIDDVNDLPEYFCIHIIINDNLEKKIKIYINKDNKRNYLKTYLSRYLKQIDDRVIFCLPDSLQATYFGIDVKKGGIVQYKDNTIGYIYNNQTTINNFDWTICQGFERNNLIMNQIIPLSFSFNVNDILNKYEQEVFAGTKIKISGFYYTKNDMNYNLFDFDINYTNMYQKYNKYNEHTGKYEFTLGNINGEKINIMNIGFPSLNESKYVQYMYTNKITPKYCKFKMLLSSDYDPYITNINFSYSYNQYPNQKYGYFPTMFKGIYVEGIVIDNDLKLPIGNDLETYYKTVSYYANKVYVNSVNSDRFIKLMTNYCSSWFNINDYNPDFNNVNFLDNTFNNSNYWTDVKYGYSYFKGILYNLNGIEKYNIDKFGVFLGVNMKYYTQEEVNNNFINARYIMSSSEQSMIKLYQYNDSYDMLITDNKTGLQYFNKIFNVFNDSITYNNLIKTKYMFVDKNVMLDEKGKYIEEKNYIEENTYYKLSDIVDINTKFGSYIKNEEIFNKLKEFAIVGYILLDGNHNINYFEEYSVIDPNDASKKIKKKRFILANKDYKRIENEKRFKWLYSDLYYSTVSNTLKLQVGNKDEYNLEYNEDVYDKFCMFLKTSFIHKNDIINILLDYNKQDLLLYLDNIESYIYEHIGTVNGIEINNYFIKNKYLNSMDIFVDPYNLNEYIDLYNNEHDVKLDKNFIKTKEYYFKAINKDHILEYFNKLYKDEFFNSTFNLKYYDIYKDIELNTYSNILNNMYVKERCWIIESGVMQSIDRYISLYDYLRQYNEDLSVYIHSFFKNEDLLNWFLDNISDTRSYNDNFVFNFNDIKIELNLCFKKQMITLNESLYKLLQSGYYLYLYIISKENDMNNNIWDILSNNDITYNNSKYDYKEIDEYLIPLFNSPYINDNDCTTIFNMIHTNKINNEHKYVLNNSKYFKEIDVDKTFKEILINNDKLIYNIIDRINNLQSESYDEFYDIIKEYNNIFYINNSSKKIINNINKKELSWLIENKEYIIEQFINNLFCINWMFEISNIKNFNSIEENDFISEWNDYCLLNSIYIEDVSKTTYIDRIELILDYIKTNYEDYYYSLIKDRGIILYSIIHNNEIKLNTINGDNLIYDESNNIYIYDYNNKRYGFYWITLDIDNSNHSFYIKNDYNLNLTFDSINNISIQSNKFDTYFNKIFYIIYPLLKFNIFNEYSKLNKNIIYPYETEINIGYIQSLLNNTEHNKYSIMKDSVNDLLYGEIVKIIDSKKIKLLRYFNYISPYLKKTDIIDDSWKLRFMNIDNEFKNTKKYNIFDKENINIYKYNGLNLYDGTYNKYLYKFTNCTSVNQYEYKHFEDNILYNLPEYIYISERKHYTQEELELFKDNKEEIKSKKIKILLKFFNKKGFDYNNIILFLFNKYDSNMIIERINTKYSISERIYKISYKFNLI